MIKNISLFALVFTLIDITYLMTTKNLFNKQITLVQGSKIKLNIYSTLLCYLILTTGIYYFAIHKKLTLVECALLGVFVYGVYETTNHAIFDNWKWSTLILDTLWGGILFSLSVYIYRKIKSI